MASIRREIRTSAAPRAVWDAIADVVGPMIEEGMRVMQQTLDALSA